MIMHFLLGSHGESSVKMSGTRKLVLSVIILQMSEFLVPVEGFNILNLTNVSFLKGSEGIKCDNSHQLLVLVHSAPKNVELRKALRSTWISKRPGMLAVFLVGKADRQDLNDQIDRESSEFNDIVQGSFLDAYRNMTYKHLLGYRWVSEHCPEVNLVLKADDDVIVDTLHLGLYITTFIHNFVEPFYLCHYLPDQKIGRDPAFKWFVSEEEFPGHTYPGYCAGWAYVTNPVTIRKVLDLAETRDDYFWIDDVYVTGVIRPKAVKVYDWSQAFLSSHAQSKTNILENDGYSPELLVCADVSPKQMKHVYDKFKQSYSKKWGMDNFYFNHENREALRPDLVVDPFEGRDEL